MNLITGNNQELLNQTSNENDFLTINIGVDVLSRQLPGPWWWRPFSSASKLLSVLLCFRRY